MTWDYSRPCNELPKRVAEEFRLDAATLQRDLLENKLYVVLVPAPRPNYGGHMIRQAETSNPEWYSKLYENHKHFSRTRAESAITKICMGEDEPAIDYTQPNRIITGPFHIELGGRSRVIWENLDSKVMRAIFRDARLKNIERKRLQQYRFVDAQCTYHHGTLVRLEYANRKGKTKYVTTTVRTEHPTMSRNSYHTLFRELIYERLTEGYACNEGYVPPNKTVCRYFGLEANLEKLVG